MSDGFGKNDVQRFADLRWAGFLPLNIVTRPKKSLQFN